MIGPMHVRGDVVEVRQKTTVKRGSTPQELLFVLDHKDAYRQIRNYLAGRHVGATRDETLLDEVIKCLFCKLYMHQNGNHSDELDTSPAIATRYRETFHEVRLLFPQVFQPSDEISLDAESISYVDRMLAQVNLTDPSRDPIGDLYEAFIGSHVRGQEGQFFTPQNAIQLLVTLVSPKPGERIIDPACGAGGFLSVAARYLLAAGASREQVADAIHGVDKDRYLANLASSHLSVVTLSPANTYCADSLAWAPEEGGDFPLDDQMGTFDVVLTNPPFGAHIVSVSPEIQKNFELGYKWRFDAKKKRFVKTTELQSSVPPQVLFIERCLSLVRPGGRIGMVVPESLISGKSYRFVVEYIRTHAHVRAVLGMPESLFKTSGKGGTHTKTCLLLLERNGVEKSRASEPDIFMAEAQWCGHDSRGRQITRDDLTTIGDTFRAFAAGALRKAGQLGYMVPADQLVGNVLAPRYYNPDVADELEGLRATHNLVTIRELVDQGVLQITSGDEIGKLAYGTGTIPFVRTSDISNWEIKLDPKQGVSDEVYETLARKQDVRDCDILMVRDGTYLIGTCALITKYDTRILYQSHLYKLRVLKPKRLSPYLLLAILSSLPVQRQIKAKRFTQDIIDSLGDRIYELTLPIPKSLEMCSRITKMVEQAIHDRIEARELARKACLEVVGIETSKVPAADLAVLETVV
jgi:type I restriction enzyme M protein